MRLLRPGDPVVLIATGECGIIVHAWESELADDVPDHYVAFFGKRFPRGKPARAPYVLRYAATSLRAVVIDEIAGRVRWRFPLHAAVEENNLTAIRMLVRAGVEQDVLDGALRRAVVHHGNLAVIRLLIRHGADVNAVDDLGGTPLFRAVYNPRATTRIVNTLLATGSRVNELIDVKFIAPPRQDRQRTALHYAAAVAPTPVVKQLLARGADPDIADKKGFTALMVAAGNGRVEAARALVKGGADPNAKTKKGLTALDCAMTAAGSRAPELRDGGRRTVSMLRSEERRTARPR